MSDANANDWMALIPGSLLKEAGLREKDIYRCIQLASAIREAVRARREKIRLAKPVDSEGQRQQDEKDDAQIFLGAMLLLAAKRGK